MPLTFKNKKDETCSFFLLVSASTRAAPYSDTPWPLMRMRSPSSEFASLPSSNWKGGDLSVSGVGQGLVPGDLSPLYCLCGHFVGPAKFSLEPDTGKRLLSTIDQSLLQ